LACFPRIVPATWANDAPLVTAANRSAPMGCGPNVDQTRPHAGAAALRAWRTLPGKADPRRLPPTSEPRPATALLGGALAGSGPGTSPCVDGLSLVSGMVAPPRPARSNHTHDVSCLAYVARLPEGEGRSLQRRELDVRRLGRWDSNPAPASFAVRGRSADRRVTCDARSPTLTARARTGPAVPDAVRTQRGPGSGGQEAIRHPWPSITQRRNPATGAPFRAVGAGRL
jgi:hypothetical protein